MINATQIRKGMIIKIEGNLFKVLETTHITPGRWKAIIQTKLRNLRDQTLMDHRFRSKDIVEQAFLEEVEMQFLYQSGDDYIFMNLENYEQIKLPLETIGDDVSYLIHDIIITVELYEGKPVGLTLPITVDLKVIKTDLFLKGATQSAQSKPATLETGLVITVPQFVKEGDKVRVDTREGKYLERVMSK